jgi:hypothetical protein
MTQQGMTRWLVCLEEVDFNCIEYIMAAHGHSKKADAVRFAIQQQKERSSVKGAVGEYQDMVAEVKGVEGPARGQVLKRWHQLYRPLDFDAMQWLMARHGLAAMADAIRLSLRVQAQVDGMKIVLKRPKKRHQGPITDEDLIAAGVIKDETDSASQ